jgi:hypothetical protein
MWHSEAYSDKPVDYEDIPKFEKPEITIAGALNEAWVDLFLLVAMNLIAALLAFLSFMRYDVR